MSIPREELFKQVWAEPMLAVAARHGVSASYLARVCACLNIPRPPRGYWAESRPASTRHSHACQLPNPATTRPGIRARPRAPMR